MMFGMHDVQLLGPANEITLLGPDDFGYGYDGMGWSLNPIKHIRSVASTAVNVGKKVGGAALKYNPLTLSYKASLWAAEKAVSPIRSKLRTLTDRRAAKLAFDRRRSKTPTAQEKNEAREWTKNRLRAKGPHGRLVALLAGGPATFMDAQLGDNLGVAPVVAVAAAIPPIVALLNTMIQSFNKSGEAPANPAQPMVDVAQQAAQTYQQVTTPVAPAEPTAEITPAAEPVTTAPVEPSPEAVQGFGAEGDPSSNAGPIVLGVLGLLAIGGGVYCAVKR
jgi:hypothetical protein